MELLKQYFRLTPLAHRISWVFILCIILPLAIVLFWSFSRLENELKEQSFQRLRFETKTISMSIMEKLIGMESELRFLGNNHSGLPKTGLYGDPKTLLHGDAHFESLSYQGPRAYSPLQGTNRPGIRSGAIPRPHTGKSFLMEHPEAGNPADISMAVPLPDSRWLSGRVNAKYLWNEDANFNLPPFTELCIVNAAGIVIVSTMADPTVLLQTFQGEKSDEHRSAFRWEDASGVYLASAFDLFLESVFAGSTWTVILSRPERAIVGPIQPLKYNLALIGVLVILIVFLLSTIFIRHSFDPLKRLTACAKAVGAGDYSPKVDVHGSPEFEELSGAFQTMAGCIQKNMMEIRESEERFRATFEESPAAIALVDADGGILKANRALSAFLGYPQEELRSRRLADFVQPDGFPGSEERQGILDFGESLSAVEKRFRLSGGQTVTGLVSASRLEKGVEHEAPYIVHILDITEQKAGQAERQKLEAQLYHAQKMEAIGTLAAGIAHDFNNILSVIIGNAEIAIQDAEAADDTRSHLENVLQASQRAADLTKQILSFSRLEQQVMSPIQLSTAVKEALKLLRSSMPPSISMIAEISEENCLVNADPSRIHQLVMNLCTNSYHAVQDQDRGTITVSLQPERTRLPEDLQDKHYLVFQVADTGCGMTPEVMNKIFEPYFTTKSKGRGTGLGMTIVHSIVKEHNGTIQMESESGRGTVIRVYFPIVSAPAETVAQPPLKPASGCESILIVEDEEDIARIWQQMLTRLGYDAVVKNHPYDALEEIRQNPLRYSLILTDLAMPDMRGDKLCREISRINPKIPLILCSGYFGEIPAESLPSVRYLQKPLRLNMLAEVVRKVIDQHETQASR
ncbi:MAG TPA: ATP-binding protein [Syntrophales bacterium]